MKNCIDASVDVRSCIPTKRKTNSKTLPDMCGLVNLGSTCFLNATLQCLRFLPELRSALTEYSRQRVISTGFNHELTMALHKLFSQIDKSAVPVAPTELWDVLTSISPHFARKINNSFMQQDAEECWTLIFNSLSQTLQNINSTAADVVTQLFCVELENSVRCLETNEESIEKDCSFFLKCYVTDKVNNMDDGVKLGLTTCMEKTSPLLGKMVLHHKDSLITKLPQYLTIQFLRCFWNRESRKTEKIIKKIDFPLVLDLVDLCGDGLRAGLETARQGLHNGRGSSGKGAFDANHNFCGIYDLVAILTHQGPSTYCGHNAAWVKPHQGEWVMFDDARVIIKTEADIGQLSGGGSGPIAYLCMYKARGKIQGGYSNSVRFERPRTHISVEMSEIIKHLNDTVRPALVKEIAAAVQDSVNGSNRNPVYNAQANILIQEKKYYRTAAPKRSSFRSDLMSFLNLFVMGVMGFLTILGTMVSEDFVAKHEAVYWSSALVLLLGLASAVMIGFLYLTGLRAKVPLWVINLLSIVCGFTTYSTVVIWATEILLSPLAAKIVCNGLFLGVPLMCLIYWWKHLVAKEEEHKDKGDRSV